MKRDGTFNCPFISTPPILSYSYVQQVYKMTGNSEHANKAMNMQSTTGDGLSQLGCALSHLKAVKTAYMAGDDIALILEDDMGPWLMPYWTVGIGDLLDIFKVTTTDWDSVQLFYHTVGTGYEEPQNRHELLGGYLQKRHWLFSTGAYLISRRGMKKVMQKFFTNATRTGLALPSIEPGVVRNMDTDAYYGRLMTENYICYPAMFLTHARVSTIFDGKEMDPVENNHHLWLPHKTLVREKYFPEIARR